MNETQPPKEFDADAGAGTASAAATTASPTRAQEPGAGKVPPETPEASRRQTWSRWLGVGLVVAVIIIVALAANLRYQKQQFDDFGREASRRLDEAAQYAQLARQQAQAAQSTAQGVERRLQDLESSTRHIETQQQALEHAWNELVVGEQNSILVDVEQSLLLAAEQLQLAGRVPSAIAALQLAEARLARSGRPAYRSAQQAIARDLKNLQSLPYSDFSQVAGQIDRMLADVASFPLMTPGLGDNSNLEAQNAMATSNAGAPGAVGARSSAAEPGAEGEATVAGDSQMPAVEDTDWWREAWDTSTAWAARTRDLALTELKRFVEVRRIDSAEAFMLSAEQADILRANLGLRLIEARMALLARVNELWRSDLEAVATAVRQYGEARSPITRRLLRDLDDLLSIDPAPDLPSLNDSLRAVRTLLLSIETDPSLAMPAIEPQEPAGDESQGVNPEAAPASAAPEAQGQESDRRAETTDQAAADSAALVTGADTESDPAARATPPANAAPATED